MILVWSRKQSQRVRAHGGAPGFGTVRSLAGFGDFGVRASIAHVMDLGASISLEGVWNNRADTSRRCR